MNSYGHCYIAILSSHVFFYRAWVTLVSVQFQSLTAMQRMTAQLRCVICTYVMQRHNQMHTYAWVCIRNYGSSTSPAQVVEVGEPWLDVEQLSWFIAGVIGTHPVCLAMVLLLLLWLKKSIVFPVLKGRVTGIRRYIRIVVLHVWCCGLFRHTQYG